MKVWYRFPDLTLWEEMQDWVVMDEHTLQMYVAKKNKTVLREIVTWLQTTAITMPQLEMKTHKNYHKDLINGAMSFNLPEGEAVLFKLKFGNGYED